MLLVQYNSVDLPFYARYLLLISFPLIAIFFFLDQSNSHIIFINKEMKLQYLNIKLHDFDIWTTWFDFYECYTTMFEYFTRELVWVANDSWNPVCQRLFIFQHVLLAWPILRVGTRELVMKSSFSQNLHQTLTHNPYIKSYKNAGKRLNIITIKFDTELNPIKNIVVNHNLQNSWL